MKIWLITGRRASCVLIVVLLAACGGDDDRVVFRMAPEGVRLSVPESGMEEDFVPFSNRFPGNVAAYSGGKIICTGADQVYQFFTGSMPVDQYLLSLPAGEYLMEAEIPPASLFGQGTASFIMEPQTIVIGDTTTLISPEAVANCALCLVRDSLDRLDGNAFILEKNSTTGYARPHRMNRDSVTGLYYAYLTPDSDPAEPGAYLWFEDRLPVSGETGMSTSKFRTGYIYLVDILE